MRHIHIAARNHIRPALTDKYPRALLYNVVAIPASVGYSSSGRKIEDSRFRAFEDGGVKVLEGKTAIQQCVRMGNIICNDHIIVWRSIALFCVPSMRSISSLSFFTFS